jgi:hypothetical protein
MGRKIQGRCIEMGGEVKTKYIKGNLYYLKVCPQCGTEQWIGRAAIYCSKSCANKAVRQGKPVTPKHFEGSKVDYFRWHRRLWEKRGKANKCCNGCITGKYTWANLTGDYRNSNDYVMMCISCHDRFDRYRVAVIM